MRSVSVQTQFDMPQATEIQRLQKDNPVIYLMIGYAHSDNPKQDKTMIQVQLNSEIISPETFSDQLDKALEKISSEERSNTIITLRADKNIPMGFINDIKKTIKEKQISSIHYGAEKQ